MKELSELKRNLKKVFSGLKKVKIAVLGDSATQFLVQAIKGTGFDHDLNLEVWEADFDQIQQQVFNPSSELFEFEPFDSIAESFARISANEAMMFLL